MDKSMRTGFGKGLVEAAKQDQRIVALAADLTESVQLNYFAEQFPDRFIQVGVAEQNLVTVASGLAAMNKIPFTGSYAAFSPGRNWEQIKTTICINDRPVKLIGSHTGLNVGPDGATHQMLEDIALMRVLPNMVVLAPGDANEAYQAAIAMAKDDRPNYIRLARSKTATFTDPLREFIIGKAYRLKEGSQVSLIGTGTMTHQLLEAADRLNQAGVAAEVIHVPTIKPLDEDVIIASAKKCTRVVVVEEAQIAGGFGGAICELLAERFPVPIKRLGVKDRYGQSGDVDQLWQEYEIDVETITHEVQGFLGQ